MDSEDIVNQSQDNCSADEDHSQDNYSADEDLYAEEEGWNVDQNDSVFTHDYLAFVKARNLLEDQTYSEIQDEENDSGNALSENNDDEQEHNTDRKIPITETKTKTKTKRSPCVIVDNSKGEIERCNSTTSLVLLPQLIGTWEIETTMEETSDLSELGVCSSHLNFDHRLHSTKPTRNTSQSTIHTKKCLLCNKHKSFFSRGDDCVEHNWNIFGRNIQVPCLGLKSCPVFQEIPNVSSKAIHSNRVRYICARCFECNGGHLHRRQGSGNKPQTCVDNGLHGEDVGNALKLFSQWLSNLSDSNDEGKKEKVLWHMMTLLESPEQTTSILPNTKCHSPSLFLVKTAMKINKLDNSPPTDKRYVEVKECGRFGDALGNFIWGSRKDMEECRKNLENPSSLDEYYDNLPPTLTSLFEGLVGSIEKQKHAVRERKN